MARKALHPGRRNVQGALPVDARTFQRKFTAAPLHSLRRRSVQPFIDRGRVVLGTKRRRGGHSVRRERSVGRAGLVHRPAIVGRRRQGRVVRVPEHVCGRGSCEPRGVAHATELCDSGAGPLGHPGAPPPLAAQFRSGRLNDTSTPMSGLRNTPSSDLGMLRIFTRTGTAPLALSAMGISRDTSPS